MTKQEFMKKHNFTEEDFENLEAFEEMRKSGVTNMYYFFNVMRKENVWGGQAMVDWIQKGDNYGEFLDIGK